jgi:hypothetical protein
MERKMKKLFLSLLVSVILLTPSSAQEVIELSEQNKIGSEIVGCKKIKKNLEQPDNFISFIERIGQLIDHATVGLRFDVDSDLPGLAVDTQNKPRLIVASLRDFLFVKQMHLQCRDITVQHNLFRGTWMVSSNFDLTEFNQSFFLIAISLAKVSHGPNDNMPQLLKNLGLLSY